MNLSSKLCNPTPWQVRFEWEPGRPIIIEPDGYATLDHDQLLDFRPGNPGSQEIKQKTDFLGIFLLDMDRSYDVQALEVLRTCYDLKKNEHRQRMQNLRDMRTASGMKPDEATMESLERQSGLIKFREECAVLEKRIKFFEDAVSNQEVKKREEIDFKTTCLATNPPRQFPSETSLKAFLQENLEIAEKHYALVEAMTQTQAPNEQS